MVEEARLESVYTPKGYPGFESPSLRKTLKTNGGETKTSPVRSRFYGNFLFCRQISKRQENAPFGQSSVTKSLLKIGRNKIIVAFLAANRERKKTDIQCSKYQSLKEPLARLELATYALRMRCSTN